MVTALAFLLSLRPALPMSVERPCTLASNGEVKRWCANKAVLINGQAVGADAAVEPGAVDSLILFPRSPARRCTLF